MRLKTTLMLLLSCVGLTAQFPVDADAGAAIEKIQMGEYWYGAQISKKDLLGKVVVLEIWGKN